ncbi:MAG: DUF2071 domain-containing protein [Bacteroidia bacterium]|nr:DUF2071 domain-containing protein [Bacteroidia bacterium]
MAKRVFLKAEWRKLLMINYEVDVEAILPYMPAHTEPDLYHGKCLVSIVGFMFLNTRVKGMKIFSHINFEEVNLRFYNTHKTATGEVRRGTTFIKEIVSKPAITFIANTLYKEKYVTLPMGNTIHEHGQELEVEYRWRYNKKINLVRCKAEKKLNPMAQNSLEEFITEHYWGYTKLSLTETSEYAVEHPRWETYRITDFHVDIDFEGLYGQGFAALKDQKPHSVLLAEGSEILVRGGDRIRA